MEREGSGGSGGSAGLLQQILSLKLVPRVGNGTLCPNSTSLCSFPEMWYGVFLWALVSSLFFHVPAGLLALFTLRHHKYGRFMSVSILLMGIVGPITAGILTILGGHNIFVGMWCWGSNPGRTHARCSNCWSLPSSREGDDTI
ncbi:transmembrane protein 170A isoform X2 [Ictidomys tridecemlineatus]